MNAKPVALAASVSFPCVMSPCVGPCVVSPCEQVEAPEGAEADGSWVDPTLSALVSNHYVSLVGSDVKIPVKTLRDTAAFDSFIESFDLPFSESSDTGDCILMRGMGLDVLPVPVHRLELHCGLVQGGVTMGVCPALSIKGVDVLLGINLAGRCVWAGFRCGHQECCEGLSASRQGTGEEICAVWRTFYG